MIDHIRIISSKYTVERLLFYGFVARLVFVFYSIVHDSYIEHIKYTDIDYNVFTNGSRALLEGRSPYEDIEYRYTPLVALVFIPNVLLNEHFGKFLLITIDTLAGLIVYLLNIYQGTHRHDTKLYLILWLFNPITIAISTRGSFEPILILIVLASLYYLATDHYVLAGLFYGISIHIKLYPVIYVLSLYMYIIQKKPVLVTQNKLIYWLKTLWPSRNHWKFFPSAVISLAFTSYVSYCYYGQDYIFQSFTYHLQRKDLQHNFSVYFYLYRLLPNHHNQLGLLSIVSQALGVAYLSIRYRSIETNRRIKLKKLIFSLFSETFLFVSLNRVCTSQYFTWYFIFLPLIAGKLDIRPSLALTIFLAWILAQANWLLFAYIHEYQKIDVIDCVGNSSILFLMINLWILNLLCSKFEATLKKI